MIHRPLISPKNIAVIGASDKVSKPGGKVLKNLLDGDFKGEIFAVNPKPVNVKGVMHFKSVDDLPETDLAILSIPAASCPEAVEKLIEKNTKAFIVFSAGFSEAGEEGEKLSEKLTEMVDRANACLIGPNCIGIINENYKGVFTTPVPEYHADGCELISSSGATAVFIMEAAMSTGLRFSNVYSIGNAEQTGVEELLEYMDRNYVEGESPQVKLLYLEHIRNPFKFMKHASSLVRKGCKIAAIKAGYSEAGSRAASSHTGAMATSDTVIRALFKKSGVVYCSGREELITIACVFLSKELKGDNIAIITHAGGSAVMLTDALTQRGLMVPQIDEEKAGPLLKILHPGSSVANPIDFLATGTADQLGEIIDFCEKLDNIDAMIVVFGSPGLFRVKDVYALLDKKIHRCSKAHLPGIAFFNQREKRD
jgi:acetate---CoA ligase (ADP-forming)